MQASLARVVPSDIDDAAPLPEPPPYLAQLDGVRALAVLLVFIAHFSVSWPRVQHFAPWGDLGVRWFFVLSGYLITGILLSARARIESARQTLMQALATFYARRALRIFPLFYLVLVLSALLNFYGARQEFVWHASYLSNFYLAIHSRWSSSCLIHFWTLAVEEQFYAVWPMVVLLVPRRFLTPLFLLLVVAGPVARALFISGGFDGTSAQRCTPACFDSLALGALFALIGAERGRLLGRASLIIGVLGLLGLESLSPSATYAVLIPVASSLSGLGVVAAAVHGVGGWMGRLLEFPPIVYIGRMSYGLYVLHMPVRYGLFPLIERRAGFELESRPAILVAVTISMSILLAIASFRLFETPLLKFKQRFR